MRSLRRMIYARRTPPFSKPGNIFEQFIRFTFTIGITTFIPLKLVFLLKTITQKRNNNSELGTLLEHYQRAQWREYDNGSNFKI